MKKVIITGATSMLAVATIKQCINNHVRVLALIRRGSKKRERIPQSELVTVMECNLDELKDIDIPAGEYDVFFHFGWEGSRRYDRENLELQYSNIGYTLDAIRLAYRSGCEKFVGAGSQAEYGYRECTISEEMPVMPTTCYGYTKYVTGKFADKLCKELGMICIWTRIFSAYGTNDVKFAMISYAIDCILNNKVAEFSSGEQKWDFLFEDDAGTFLYLLGDKAQESCVVNVAAGENIELKAYFEKMSCVLKEKYGMKFDYTLSKEGPKRDGISANIGKLKSITGYTPKVDFKTGFSRVLESKMQKEGTILN